MPTWKCPLCGNAYESAGEQRPIVCAGCESLIYDTGARERRIPRRPTDAPGVFPFAGEEEAAESQSQCERKDLPNPPHPHAPALAVAGLLTVVALGGLGASRFAPFADGLTQVSDPLIDATCGKDQPFHRTFRADRPWSLEWTMTSTDSLCLSSVQVWDEHGDRIGVVSSPSGRKDFDSVGEHRIVVHASRNDRVHVLAKEL